MVGGWCGLQSHFVVKPNHCVEVVLRLGWGIDKNFFLASTVWEWCPKQIPLYLLKSDKKRLPVLYEDLKGNTFKRAFLPILPHW